MAAGAQQWARTSANDLLWLSGNLPRPVSTRQPGKEQESQTVVFATSWQLLLTAVSTPAI